MGPHTSFKPTQPTAGDGYEQPLLPQKAGSRLGTHLTCLVCPSSYRQPRSWRAVTAPTVECLDNKVPSKIFHLVKTLGNKSSSDKLLLKPTRESKNYSEANGRAWVFFRLLDVSHVFFTNGLLASLSWEP